MQTYTHKLHFIEFRIQSEIYAMWRFSHKPMVRYESILSDYMSSCVKYIQNKAWGTIINNKCVRPLTSVI